MMISKVTSILEGFKNDVSLHFSITPILELAETKLRDSSRGCGPSTPVLERVWAPHINDAKIVLNSLHS
jgi:hypothetical protein